MQWLYQARKRYGLATLNYCRGAIQVAAKERQDEWTGSIAVGSKAFIDNVKARLGFRAKGRDVIESGEGYQLRENLTSYKALFKGENEDIDLANTNYWDVKPE